MLGFVTDATGDMATWSAPIVPLSVGGGMRIKMVGFFNRQCPVVSARVHAYGYE